jgi:hypothetical protein
MYPCRYRANLVSTPMFEHKINRSRQNQRRKAHAGKMDLAAGGPRRWARHTADDQRNSEISYPEQDRENVGDVSAGERGGTYTAEVQIRAA